MTLAGWGARLALVALIGATALMGGGAPISTAQDATPTAELSPTETFVTFVALYTYDAGQDALVLAPVASGADYGTVAMVPDAAQVAAVADMTAVDNNGQPRITLGTTVLDARPRDPADPDTASRWVWLDDVSGERPATLVLQVEATAGPYVGATGTATFVSRGSKSGGVLVVMLLIAGGS